MKISFEIDYHMRYSLYIRHVGIKCNTYDRPFCIPLSEAEHNVLKNYKCRTDIMPGSRFFYRTGGDFPDGRFFVITNIDEQDKLVLSLLGGIVIDLPAHALKESRTSSSEYINFPPLDSIMKYIR